MKRLLIVGATGFVGQAMLKSYRENGWFVSTMGRNPEDNYQLENVASLKFDVQYDRLIDVLAVNETTILQDLNVTYQMNVVLTRQLVELCRNNQIKEFVYLSTFHIYGQSSGLIDESSPAAPKNDYALTHYLSERIIADLSGYGGYRYLILRPTNIYGLPADLNQFRRWTLIPFDFVRRAVTSNDITLQQPYTQRNFVAIDEVIAAVDFIGRTQVLNVFGEDTMTILQFAQLVVSTVEVSESKIHLPSPLASDGASDLVIRSLNPNFLPHSQLVDFIQKFANMVAKNA